MTEYDDLPTYRGYLVRHPAPPELAIDPRPFGYLDPEQAAYCRLRRSGTILGTQNPSSSRPTAESAASKPV